MANPSWSPPASPLTPARRPSTATSSSPSPCPSPSNVAAFRLLLPCCSDAEAIRLYGASAALRRMPGVDVRVEPLGDSSAPQRVVIVAGPTSPKKRTSSLGELLSPAQEALLAVADEVISGPGEAGDGDGTVLVASRLLVEADRVERLARHGGAAVIGWETGTEVKVFPWDDVQRSEEVVQITGDRVAVRKALVAISCCLHYDPPACRSQILAKTEGLQESSPKALWLETFSSEGSTEYAEDNLPLMTSTKRIARKVQTKGHRQLSFRLLCSNDLVGGVIGTKAFIVKEIETETGASVRVGASACESMERVITISALEYPGLQSSKAQSAVLRVFDRMVEVESELHSSFNELSQLSARLLVLKSQFGCLVGTGGTIIQEMVKTSRARIHILEDEVPACASEYEIVVQITGKLQNVRDALYHVTLRLRDHIFSSKMTNFTGGSGSSSTVPELDSKSSTEPANLDQHFVGDIPRVYHLSAFNYQMDALEKSMDSIHLSSESTSEPQCAHGDHKAIKTAAEGITPLQQISLGRGIKTVTVTRITYEIVVPASLLGLVYGANGNTLSQIRQISGAEVVVHDPCSGAGESMVIISGSPAQAQAAQSLLQAFILSGQSSPDPTCHEP